MPPFASLDLDVCPSLGINEATEFGRQRQITAVERRVMHHTSLKPLTRVGLISTAPMRLAGLYGAFENHPYIQIVFGDLEGILSDPTLGFLILDVCCGSEWLSIHNRVQEARPDIRRIVLGPAEDDETMIRYLEGGARAYLDLNAGPLAVRQAVEAVIEGLIWAPRRVLSRMIDRLMSRRPEVVAPRTRPSFSPRERQVLDLIMTASSNREIASELGIEERTVKAYVASLMRKTGVDNRVTLSVMAVQRSLLGKEVATP